MARYLFKNNQNVRNKNDIIVIIWVKQFSGVYACMDHPFLFIYQNLGLEHIKLGELSYSHDFYGYCI
jgi:hypothetical protein